MIIHGTRRPTVNEPSSPFACTLQQTLLDMTARYSTLLLLFALPFFTMAQTWRWATAFYSTGQSLVEAVAALPDDGALVCGEFNDTLRTATDTLVTHGGWDGFLARLDAEGNVLWIHGIGGPFDDGLNDVVVDAAGNAYAAAAFRDTVQWAGTSMPGPATSGATLVKFDLDGNVIWEKRAVGNSYAYTVSAGTNGMVYFGGVLNNTTNFSGTTLTNNSGIYNAFLVRYSGTNGALVDASMISGSTGDYGAYGMDVDAAGNAYLTGYSRPQQNPYVGTFMRKRAFDGSSNWSQTISSAFGDLYGRDVSVASDGHVYFTGNIHNNVDWMGSNLGQYGRYKNAYLARFSTDGTLSWVQQAGHTGEDLGLGVVTDGLGSAYWTGCFYRQAQFDTIAVNASNNSTWQDLFVARSEPQGGVAFVTTAGGGSDERATCIDKRVDGPVIIGGHYLSWNAQFGALTLPQGGRLFVAAMGVPDDDLSTGVAAAPAQRALHLYPVPASSTLFLAMHGGRGTLEVTLIDVSGRTASIQRLGAPLGSLDVSGLSPGPYLVRCVDADGTVMTARVVIEQ